MIRDSEKWLTSWYIDGARKPLVLRGARQVGKSTLVRNFAESKGLILHEINLERQLQLRSLIQNFRVDSFINEVQLLCKKGSLNSPHSLLFIDEIQAIPEALGFLRYLQEDKPQLPVVCAGSLLEFALQDKDVAFSMPVGRVFYHFLGPCTFFEFLKALGKDSLLSYLSEYQITQNFSPTAHLELSEILRTYLLIGGMPEALAEYLRTQDFESARKILGSIVLTYRDDFLKYAKKTSLINLYKVLDYLPRGIAKKVKYVNIDEHARSLELKKAVTLLSMAGIICPAYSSTATIPPLSSAINEKAYKLYALDCGILNALSRTHSTTPSEVLHNEDDLAEQFIAQHLRYLGPNYLPPELYYWLREGKSNNAEIDFLFQHKNTIIPIEVKSGSTGKLRSLHQYIHKTGTRLAVRFDSNPPSIQTIRVSLPDGVTNDTFQLLSLPLYMIGELDRILGTLHKIIV